MIARAFGPGGGVTMWGYDLVVIDSAPEKRTHRLKGASHHVFEGAAEPGHDLVDLRLGNDEGRRQHDEVAVDAIGLPRGRPPQQSRTPGGGAGTPGDAAT